MAVSISLIGATNVYANPKKGSSTSKPTTSKPAREKTAQECKAYTDKVDSQTKIVKHRFYDLHRDIHKLYPKYNTVPHPQGHGTYQGHIGRYNTERKDLGQYITEATLSKCEKYVSAEARKWRDRVPPKKPEKSVLAEIGE